MYSVVKKGSIPLVYFLGSLLYTILKVYWLKYTKILSYIVFIEGIRAFYGWYTWRCILKVYRFKGTVGVYQKSHDLPFKCHDQ